MARAGMTENGNQTEEGLLLAFYGDDFTGSTDSLEGLAANGVRAMLFQEPPSQEDLERLDGVDAIGVAGASRSMTPSQMAAELPPTFSAINALDPPIIHYKVCSTFDSAPHVGSIGRAIELGQSVFDSSIVPVSQGTQVPSDRHVAFSNLFATYDGRSYRIDRHPIMRDHPVTPMSEGDLRRHLSQQTDESIGRVSVRHLGSDAQATSRFDTVAERNSIMILDATGEGHLHRIGRLLWERARTETGPLFVVGSSGLEHHALVHAWQQAGRIDRDQQLYYKRDPVEKVLVLSGSASATTAKQIDWASEHGFHEIRLDTAGLVDPETARGVRKETVEAVLTAMSSGESVVCYTAKGPHDEAISETKRRFESLDIENTLEARLGQQQGLILRGVIEESNIKRVCVAGGDTSSLSVRELDIHALEAIAPVGPGGPLCRVHADDRRLAGLEIAMKGGQVTTRSDQADYFGVVRNGGAES